MSKTTTTIPLIELKDIFHTYSLDTGRKINVLNNVNLTVNAGDILVLLGPSGSGKSTCLRIIAGLLAPSEGSVLCHGKPLECSNPDVALVFQSFALLPWKNVVDNVALGVKPLHLSREVEKERIKRAIDLVGLEGFEEAYPKELSGGMKQRVGIARALVMERAMLCLDEPFSALDVLTAETLRKEVLNLWLSRKTATKGIILVTHNITEAVSMGSRILVMGTAGNIGFSIKNELSYPRDEKSSSFKELVENIHDLLTQAIIPDTPDWIPPALAEPAIESLPSVGITEVVGILEFLYKQAGRADAFALAERLQRESMHVLILAKAAELLDFVDTPKNQIVLTDLGRAFVRADVNGRKRFIHRQLMQLKIAQIFHQRLSLMPDRTMSVDDALTAIHEWLPNEDSHKVLHTLIQWGRYGELFGYNADDKQVYLDIEGEQQSMGSESAA